MHDRTDTGSHPFLFDDDLCDEVTAIGTPPNPADSGSTHRGLTILVVEDDPLTTRALARLLGALGHRVVTAADGAEAWSLLQSGGARLVLSDWMMPGMDGRELCRRIRGREDVPYTYVILASAWGGCEDRLEGLAAGADDLLAKPIDERELAAKLEIARRILAIQEGLERKNAALRAMAATDELTGLANRRRFDEALRSHVSLAARRDLPLSLVPLQGVQRRLRPPGGRRGPARVRPHPPRQCSGPGRGGAVRRRGVRRPAAGDRGPRGAVLRRTTADDDRPGRLAARLGDGEPGRGDA